MRLGEPSEPNNESSKIASMTENIQQMHCVKMAPQARQALQSTSHEVLVRDHRQSLELYQPRPQRTVSVPLLTLQLPHADYAAQFRPQHISHRYNLTQTSPEGRKPVKPPQSL